MKFEKNLDVFYWEPMIVEYYEGERFGMPFVMTPSVRVMATSLKEAEGMLLKKYPDFYTDPRDWRFAGSIRISECCIVLDGE